MLVTATATTTGTDKRGVGMLAQPVPCHVQCRYGGGPSRIVQAVHLHGATLTMGKVVAGRTLGQRQIRARQPPHRIAVVAVYRHIRRESMRFGQIDASRGRAVLVVLMLYQCCFGGDGVGNTAVVQSTTIAVV